MTKKELKGIIQTFSRAVRICAWGFPIAQIAMTLRGKVWPFRDNIARLGMSRSDDKYML